MAIKFNWKFLLMSLLGTFVEVIPQVLEDKTSNQTKRSVRSRAAMIRENQKRSKKLRQT